MRLSRNDYRNWIICSILWTASWSAGAQVGAAGSPIQLVREVVYNELHDHEHHGYWRYWVRKEAQRRSILEEQVETADGPINRLVASDGRALGTAEEQEEQDRLNRLLHSVREQARQRQDYAEDEKRTGRILALLPDAFLFEAAGEENGCTHLRFRPNPNYPAHSIEERVFHAMSGELWIDTRFKRLARLDGKLIENVDFGYGILGRLYKGGWFRLERTRVSATDWKTAGLELHLSGRALLLKTIAHETSEVRGGFTPVPAGLSLAQGLQMLMPLHATAAVTQASFAGPH